MNAKEIFGKDAELDDSNPDDPKLIIRLQNFENTGNGEGEIINGTGLNNVNVITSSQWLSQGDIILTGILKLHLQNQPTNNDSETESTFIQFDPKLNKQFVTRNNVGQIQFSYIVQTYINDPTPNLNLDLLI